MSFNNWMCLAFTTRKLDTMQGISVTNKIITQYLESVSKTKDRHFINLRHEALIKNAKNVRLDESKMNHVITKNPT